MTADFTRWAKNGKIAVLAASSAFPIANVIAFLVGAVIVASGAVKNPAANGGNFLPFIANGHGWLLSTLALLFIFINLGSVCTHCLYNGAVGWSHILGSSMRRLTIVLGVLGTVAALAGVWSLFLDWLNILGVFVPPIGAVVIMDQLLMRRTDDDGIQIKNVRWTSLLAWAVGAGAAGIVHFSAPQYVEVLAGIAAAAIAYAALALSNRGAADRTSTETVGNRKQ